MSLPPVPNSGVWAPTITFFDHTTDRLDTESQAKYYKYLSSSGLAGLVVLGTNSETFLLTREERKILLQVAREACGPSYPIMAGVGGHSTKQVLEFINDAADAGADYVLLFFDDIATASPLPIVIYNFPAVCNGIDLDSATIAKLAKKHSNIICSLWGQSDFLIGGLAAGSAGTIAGFANVFPKTIVKIYDLYQEGKIQEAMALHKKAALAEQPCKTGIASVKYAAARNTAVLAGIEEAMEKLKPRRPYLEPSETEKRDIESQTSTLVDIERSL
ncbi:hypothetical protein N7450_002075 [Penicillium hetheringtonii]|uniref:Uncharacterized protein n=1 Tax=Penicillium hetheringtonii TaxID=911720 RepID=A0AAD6GXV6_9EURO|nr:hypothetical protein N7450_002075 [Penicillium hetheringtonii]